VIEADDGHPDGVECGSGHHDEAYIDVRPISVADGIGNCEYVNGKKMD